MLTTTDHQNLAFTNSQVLDLVNFRGNVKSGEDITTASWTEAARGRFKP